MTKSPLCITDKYITELTPEQKAAALSGARYSKIIAAAGSGKTKTIVAKVLHLIDQGFDPASIVAFTFTEKAAAELKQRIYENAGECLVPEVVEKIGSVTASTIHAFCLNLIQSRAQYRNYSLLDEEKTMALLLRYGSDVGISKAKYYQIRCKKFLDSLNVVYDEMIPLDEIKKREPEFHDKILAFEELLTTHRFFSFGKIIRLAVELIDVGSLDVSNLKHLLVDEYQDVNRAQHRLVELIGNTAQTVTGVGDTRQCIYEWRGSNPEIFLKEFFPQKCETFSLSTNFRSVPAVIEAANKVASKFDEVAIRTKMVVSDQIDTDRKNGGKFIHFSGNSESDQAKIIAQSIKELINSGYKPSDIAILLRSINSAQPIISALDDLNIEKVVAGRIGLFGRPEVKAVGKLFVWTANSPWFEGSYKSRIKIDADQLLDSAVEDWKEATGIKANKEQLEFFREQLRDGGYEDLSVALQDLMIKLNILSIDPSDKRGGIIWANLGRFNELLTDFQAPYRLQGRVVHWGQELIDLGFYIDGYAQQAYDRNENDLLKGTEAVQIMTIHKAKGLEWPIVFVPNLVKQRFPVSFTGRIELEKWELPTDMFDEPRYRGSIDSERKLLYVALTRARDLLFCSVFNKDSANRTRKPSILAEELEVKFNLNPEDHIPKAKLHKPKNDSGPLQIFAPTQILYYRRCPFCYFLRFECGYQPPVRQPIGFGKSVHAALHGIAERLKEGIPVSPEDVDKIINETFHLPFASRRLIATMKGTAGKLLKKHTESDAEALKSARDIEARIEFPLETTFVIAGRIDLIVNENNELEIRDYKTAFEEEGPVGDGALQLQMYTAGLRKTGEEVERATLVFLNENKKEYIDVNTETIQNALAIASDCVKGIANKNFISSPEREGCSKCDYKRFCGFCDKKVKEA